MNLNKSLLASALVGAIALTGTAAAADLDYATGQQITYAKDLIVNNGTTIQTPNSLRLIGTSVNDASNIDAIGPGEIITVKVTLTNEARFDSTAPAIDLVSAFTQGGQTSNGAMTLSGTPYYSASGQELNFSYIAGDGDSTGDYFLELNSMQITNLVKGLFEGSSVGAEITVQNQAGVQILAAKAEIAKSKWGLAVRSVPNSGDATKTIDSAACDDSERKTLFSPTGAIGGSCNATGNDYFNAGAFELDVATALEVGAGASTTPTYVNNFSAVASDPEYNIVGTAEIAVTVSGMALGAFGDEKAYLTNSGACDLTTSIEGELDSTGNLVFASDASDPLWAGVTNASPSASTAYVCLLADGETQMEAQDLSGSVVVNYNLTTQRVDPPAMPFSLLPLRQNGVDMVFQNVNPGGNSTAQSFLRMTNNTADVCPVTLVAKDDAGLLSGEVNLTLAPHASMQLNSEHLENGGKPGVTGSFGDGTGKWYVRVSAECSNFKASALNRHHDGVVTNLTPEKEIGIEWLTPSQTL